VFIFWIILLLLGFGGLLYSMKNQKKNANAQAIAIGCVIVICIALIGLVARSVTGSGIPREIIDFAKERQKMTVAKLTVMGRYLNEKHPGAKVVYILDEGMDSPNDRITLEQIKVLKKVTPSFEILGTEIVIYPKDAVPTIVSGGVNGGGIGASAFNAIFDRHKGADLFLIFASLPSDFTQVMQFAPFRWTKKGGSQLVFCGDEMYDFVEEVERGSVAVTVISKKGSNSPSSDKQQKLFDQHFMLITPENVEAFLDARDAGRQQ